MNDLIELIRKSNLIKHLSIEEIENYLNDNSFIIVKYNKDNIVHFDGELCTKLEIILDGKVVIERIDEDGNLMTIAEFISDNVLGGNLLFSKNPYYPMTITVKKPAKILEIKKELLLDLFSENHKFLMSFLEFISDNAAMLGNKIKHYVNRSIRECVHNYLEKESKEQNTNHIILKISKKALAEKIGVQRTSLSRELSKMKAEGLIEYDRNTITILYNL